MLIEKGVNATARTLKTKRKIGEKSRIGRTN